VRSRYRYVGRAVPGTMIGGSNIAGRIHQPGFFRLETPMLTRRRWLRFSLRTLIVLTLVSASRPPPAWRGMVPNRPRP
jgi:hypothetical protein